MQSTDIEIIVRLWYSLQTNMLQSAYDVIRAIAAMHCCKQPRQNAGVSVLLGLD